MGSWTIYNKNGVAKAIVKELELHDEWMAECFLTVTINSATPIQFGVGDYLDYRGERYTIEYDPNVIKRATSGTYGEGFVYDGIKFVGSQDEIVRCDFNDIVLSDNLHYTGLPTFPFYCESVDDLLDRIQANLEDLYPNQWIVIGLNTVRNSQRGSAVGRQTAFENAYKKWIDPDMTPHTDPYGKQSVAETADNITCWDALAKVHEDFGLNFIVRGKVVVVGTAGVFTANTFRYGKGNGLTEIEKVGDSSQQIVTRLRAYGSETNLPLHYYSAINMRPYGNVVEASATGIFQIDVDFDTRYFIHGFSSGETDIAVQIGSTTYSAKAYNNTTTGKININVLTAISVAANAKVYITEGVKRDMWPSDHKDYTQDALPENMAVSRLMLPMFPNTSLYDWVKAHRDTGTEYDDATGLATYHGITAYFSKEPHRPYIDSLNKAQYGVRPASIYFDGSNETDDIHPTIEGMTYNNVRIDAVYSADQISDSGVYDDSSIEVPNFHITLPDLGFNLAEVYEENASIDMKDGMCGGRSFKFASKPTQDSNGRWVCEVQRDKDENLNLFFPYSDFQITSGDHYVLTGIQMPDAYIEAAAVKLLDAALDALQKNEAPRFTYQPKIDKNFMQRQHDTAMSSQGVVSLHDTLKAGDVFVFADADMGIDASIIIDVLTIKENGDNGIPTYEITLRDEKQVSTIQKIQNKIDSVINGAININSGVGGLTAQQVRSLINNYGGEQFLSKLNDDTAQGYIKMLQGLQIGASFVPDILGEGGVLRMRDDGKVELVTDILYARMKAYFDTVEVREYQHTGGNRIASVAGNRMCRVEWYDANNQVLEQTSTNLSSVAYFRCYFRASDGEDTVRNNWVVGDLAYCHVTSITNSSDNPEQKGLNQKHLWRLVIGRNTEGTLTEDGEAYIDLSNRATETISGTNHTGYQSGSDIPAAQDDIIQLGNVNDTTRQGAIVEFVTGTDAPSYQIFQNINSFSLSGKNQIGFGYNTSTGRAYMNVYGDFRFGSANDNGSFIKYNAGNGTLDVKAKINAQSTIGSQSMPDYIKANQNNYDDTAVVAAIGGLESTTESLQRQIDGAIDTWYYDYMPVAESQGAPANRIPLTNVEPYKTWYIADNGGTASEVRIERERHLDDIFYDNSTGYAFRFSLNESTQAFEWVVITDSAVLEALERASKAQATADGKMTIYSVYGAWVKNNINTLQVGDLYIPTSNYPASGTPTYYAKKVYKCTTDGSATFEEIAYTDDSTFNGYINALLNGSGSSGDAATAAAVQRAIIGALGGTTVIDGGLMLTSLLALRKLNDGGDPTDVDDYTTWAGISGVYDSQLTTGGIAAWYGGDMLDKETLTATQIADGWNGDTYHLRWAKSLFRFDGSGYLADGNITWTAAGSMTIRNLTTIYGSQGGGVDVNTLSSLTGIFHTETYGTDPNTELLVKPQNAFSELFINRSGTAYANYPTDKSICDYSVLNFGEMKARFITKDFFARLFQAFNGSTAVDVNDLTTTIDNIKAMFDFWSQGGITALGQGSGGGGGGGSTTLYGLNDVTENATHDGVYGAQDGYVLTYNGTTNHWYAAATAPTYTLPQATSGALGGIKIGYTASGKNYPIVLDNNGKAYVNVPWTDHYAWSDITNKPLTLTANTTGFSISGGTTSKTLTVSETYTLGAACAKGVTDNSSSTAVTSSDTNLITGRTLYYAGYVKSSGVTSVATGTGLTGGTITSTGTISINSTYQTYISHGESAYNSLGNYLSLTGGTITSGGNTPLTVVSTSNTVCCIMFKTDNTHFGTIEYYPTGNGYGTILTNTTGNSFNYVGIASDGIFKYNNTNIFIHDGNWSSYIGTSTSPVGYASVANSVAWTNVSGRPTNVSSFTNDSGYITSSALTDYLPLSGGTLTGATHISASVSGWASTITNTSKAKLYICGTSYNGMWISSAGTNSADYAFGVSVGDTQLTGAGTCALIIQQNGNIGINTANPNEKLHINGGCRATYLTDGGNSEYYVGASSSGLGGSYKGLLLYTYRSTPIVMYNMTYVGIGTKDPSYKLHVSGDIYATGGVTSLSDIRKKDVLSYELPLSVEQIANAPTIKFLWKDKREEGEQVGTIAQYWEQVLPQAIKSKSGELSMSYGVAALVSAITTARKVVDHEARIKALERENRELKEELNKLKIA